MDSFFLIMSLFGSNYLDIGIAIIFVLLHFLAEPLRWLVYASDKNDNNFRKFFSIFSFTAFASYILPFKLGLPFRLYLLKKEANLTLEFIAKYMTIDGGVYYLCWFISAAIAASFGMSIVLNENINYLFVLVFSVMLISAVLISYATNCSPYKKVRILKFIKKSKTVIYSLFSVNYTTLIYSAIISIIDIGSQVFRHYFIVAAIGYDMSLYVIAAITCTSIFTGLISMMPMGLLGYDAALIILLQQAGIPFESSIFVPIINRCLTLSTACILGILSAYSLNYSPLQSVYAIKNLIQR